MSKLLLLPSAKLVPPELQTDLGSITSAMIPLDSRPALHYITEPYSQRGYKTVVAVHEQAEAVSRYLVRHPELEARIVDVGDTGSLGETVLAALEAIAEPRDLLVINFADTYVMDPLPDGDFICYAEQEDVYRWTTFQLSETGMLYNLAEKGQVKPFDQDLLVFVGVFGIANQLQFLEDLRHALATSESEGQLDPFYQAITMYFNRQDHGQEAFTKVLKWHDFGHVDTYYATKKALFINKRFFNDVQIDNSRGIVYKHSSDVQKLTREIKWYLKLPKGLKHIGPRVLDYSLTPGKVFLEMEFYGYPVLNDIYLFGDLNLGVWSQILEAIERTINDMAQYRFAPAATASIRADMREIYVHKTLQRIEPIMADARFAPFSADEITINGRQCYGLRQVLRVLPDLAETLNLYELPCFTVIHGDLCLGNILYDPRNRIVRLIDPRGSFGSQETYGDPRYDLAKLCHSLEGDYDFFVNGLFDFEWQDGGLWFSAHLDEHHQAIKSLFHRWLTRGWGPQYTQLKLIESLLFLSMVPLHADRFRSQQAFLARGLETFTATAFTSLGLASRGESA